MSMPDLKTLRSIAPVREHNPRKGKDATLVRERLGTALGLKPYLWVPRIIHRETFGDKGINGSRKAVLSLHNGTVLGCRTLMPRSDGRDPLPWVYTRMNAPFTRCNERIGLHQRLLRHLASLGVKPENYKVLRRIFKVGFQVPISHLRKMVRQVVLSCHGNCCKTDSQPMGTAKWRSYQYPSLSGETKSIVKYGISVPLWNRYSGLATGGCLTGDRKEVGA